MKNCDDNISKKPNGVEVDHRNYSPQVKNAVLLLAVLSGFMTPFMGAAVNVSLPTIKAEFDLNDIQLSWIATAYLLMCAICLVPFGKLADRVGRKKIFVCGIVVFILTSLLCAVSTSGVMLIICRAIQGGGTSLIFGTSVAMVTSAFGDGERGKALGINVAAVYCGLSCGPLIGGAVTEHIGWRSLFLIAGAIGVVILWVVFKKLKTEWTNDDGHRFDLFGALLYGVMLSGFIWGLSRLPSALGGVFVGVSICGLALFAWWESRVQSPVLDVKLFAQNRVFALSSLSTLINYSATFGAVFLLSLYLQEIKGLSPQKAGLVLMTQPMIMMVFSPFAGKLSDRFESRFLASIGMAVSAISLVMFATMTAESSVGFIILSLLIFGFGLACFSSPNVNAVMSSVDETNYGVASAMVGTMRLTGQMLSMGITMMIFAICIGEVTEGPEYQAYFVDSVKWVFGIFAFLCLLGVAASSVKAKARA